MPLQNRVAPNGEIFAVPERGTMMGNRGGKFHRDDQTLGKRRWASSHWICCDLHWKDQHHEPMGQGYTSLFFLDEVTALAAGHRPCFFCRRKEAKAFLGGRKVGEFDAELHEERLSIAAKNPLSPSDSSPNELGEREVNRPPNFIDVGRQSMRSPNLLGELSEGLRGELPDGTMVECDSSFFAKRGTRFLRWSFAGYDAAVPTLGTFKILTPPLIMGILASGYQPRWHASALQWDAT
jgi:hypothetical protein